MLSVLAVAAVACGVIPFDAEPAAGYPWGSTEPLRVAIVDETGGSDWSPSVDTAVQRYSEATAMVVTQRQPAGAHIVVTIRRYRDEQPPALDGYRFEAGVGGFAAVYDSAGDACNFPPSPLPLNCSGAIARADIYLNDIIPAGADIDARRLRLILHEMGHAFGLTRHSPDLGIAQLAQRYGWDS